MTVKQAYHATLVELNKVSAPNFLLEDFNYYINKAIYQYINKRYNIYDINQQTTDDIRVLKSTAILIPQLATDTYGPNEGVMSLYGNIYEVILPPDYLHCLNCICNFKVLKTYECYDKDDYVQFGAKRLTSDMWTQVIRNFYLRPSYRNPYYFIHNVNSSDSIPTNLLEKIDNEKDLTLDNSKGTDGLLPSEITIGDQKVSLIEKPAGNRVSNSSQVRLEIRYGKDSSVFKLTNVFIDYIKAPQKVRLTQTQYELVEDTSQVLEFPDYVCHEIINELVKLLLENASDPRLQTNLAVNQTIASPIQQQSQSNKK